MISRLHWSCIFRILLIFRIILFLIPGLQWPEQVSGLTSVPAGHPHTQQESRGRAAADSAGPTSRSTSHRALITQLENCAF